MVKHFLCKVMDCPTVSFSIIDIVNFELIFTLREVTYDFLRTFSIFYDCGAFLHILSINRFSLANFLKELNSLIKLFFEYLRDNVIGDFCFQHFNNFIVLALCIRVYIFNLQFLNLLGQVFNTLLYHDVRFRGLICFFQVLILF